MRDHIKAVLVMCILAVLAIVVKAAVYLPADGKTAVMHAEPEQSAPARSADRCATRHIKMPCLQETPKRS